jgi:hypothetical protein
VPALRRTPPRALHQQGIAIARQKAPSTNRRNAMARDHTTDIEQAVRDVLSEVFSGISAETSSSESGRGMGLKTRASRSASPTPPEQDTDSPDIPPDVLSAVEDLCSDLSADQAGALATLFEAIAAQSEEESDESDESEEMEEGDEGIEAKAYSAMELGSAEEARAQGKKIAAKGAAGAIGKIIQMLMKNRSLLNAAVRAAKQGVRAFTKWVNSLSSFNPVKWAIKALPSTAISLLIDQLDKLNLGRRTAAAR